MGANLHIKMKKINRHGQQYKLGFGVGSGYLEMKNLRRFFRKES